MGKAALNVISNMPLFEPPCSVAELAEQYRDLSAALENVESAGKKGEPYFVGDVEERLWARLEAVETLAAFTPATSIEGVLFQCAIIKSECQGVQAFELDKNPEELVRPALAKIVAAIESVRGWLRCNADNDPRLNGVLWAGDRYDTGLMASLAIVTAQPAG